jgi:hypothetical protein
MDIYNMTGSIFIEGTMEEADYDFEMEWDSDVPPTDMDALHYMMDSGIIQIMHRTTEFVGTDEEW